MSLIKTQVIDSRNLLRGVTHIPYSKRKSNLEYSQQIDKDDPEELVNLIPESINLILSFRNIAHIENLTGLSNLQKLCLDNNDLSEINNLSHLINLKWLDLSFNRITKIEGLDQLYNLEDLSLYSNKIKSVEGLNSCTKLKCLSLGKNDISELSDLVSIKQLHSLRMLTLANNPLCRINNYKESICLLLPFIDYLDYRLVDIFERKNKYDECIDDEITKQTKLSSEPIHLDDDHFHYIDLALEVFFENGVNKKWIESKDPSVASVVNQLLVLKEKYREALKNLDQEFRDSCTRYKHESDTTASLVEEDRSALVAGYEQARLTVSKPIAERENKTTFAQWRESLIGLDKQFILVKSLFRIILSSATYKRLM